jgi:asparagine synthase (glutamine-hydrolysing)
MGIVAGVWAGSPEIARRLVHQMRPVLSQSSPDGVTVWQDGEVALLHGALHTTPEAQTEPLPLVDPTSGTVITADLRLDNRDELTTLLELDLKARDMGDAELALRAFRRWGGQCPERMLGDFALAIWDSRARRVVMARDQFGIRPLYYHRGGGVFAFSSDRRVLLALDCVVRAPDERRVVDYLLRLDDDEESTFFRAIRRLPPACVASVGIQGIEVHEYWRLDPNREVSLSDDDEYGETLRAELSRAVACRLRSNGTTAATLSGGLDSSSVACLAARQIAASGRGRLHTVSAVFDNLPNCDERPYQRSIVSAEGTLHHEVRPLGHRPSFDLARVLSVLPEPGGVGSHWTTWPVFERSRELNARVLLTGLDGDRVVSFGHGWHAELAASGRWFELARELWATKLGLPGFLRAFVSSVVRVPLPPSLLVPLDARRAASTDWLRAAKGLVRPETMGRTGAAQRARAMLLDARVSGTHSRREHAARLARPNRTHDLEFTHASAAHFGVEVRHPFLDRRVVELCLAFPGHQKRRRGIKRYVLRTAMRGVLTEKVRCRTDKATFDGPNRRCGEAVMGTLQNWWEVDGLEQFLDIPAARQLHESVQRQGNEVSWAHWALFWRCAMLAFWLKGIVSPTPCSSTG